MMDWFQLVAERFPELLLRTGEHILLTGISTLVAISIGVPLGVLASRRTELRGFITGTTGMLQTIPSLAMLAFLLALTGRIGSVPALIALSLYALLPIVRNTLAGITGLPPATLEAADGIGMTPNQRLWTIELPLAAPVIVTGIRTAAVVGVGIATLSAFIGAGGLGQFINRGLSLSNNQLILLGAVPSAILALVVDASIGAVQWSLGRRSAGTLPRPLNRAVRIAAFASPAVLLLLGVLAVAGPRQAADDSAVVRIGSKNFTEQLILGEMLAQLVEEGTELRVERRLNLGGTMISHGALVNGEIDLYPEYTGTALTAVLGAQVIADPDEAYSFVSEQYASRFGLVWLEPFGFNNTYALTMRRADAEERSLIRISDLAPIADQLSAGWTAEFSERPDGYPGLAERYGFRFGTVRDLDASLMYQAVADGEVDVISAFATDGRIAAFDLKPLEDDKGFFPPYYAAPVVRAETLDQHPELREVLNELAGKISDETMQRLNFEVDQQQRRPADVAREFLQEQGLLPAATGM